jgi:hypothetical protein
MRAVGVGLVFLVGCSSATTARSTPSTTTAIVTTVSVTTTATAPTTTTVAATTTTVAPISVSAGPCAIGEANADNAEATFERNDRLIGVSALSTGGFYERCLGELAPGDDGAILWGPQGDRYLIGNQTFVVGDTRAATGFAPTDIATWSAPKGTALLRVDPITHTLSKRNNLDDTAITPLPVMTEAYDALYHPAGRNIAVVGRPTSTSTYGIWLISNDGANPTIITSGEEAKRIRLQRWDNYEGARTALVFWAEHLDGERHLHSLLLPGLGLDNLGGSVRLEDQQRSLPGDLPPTADCAPGPVKLEMSSAGMLGGLVTVPLSARTIRADVAGRWGFAATRSTECVGPEDIWMWPLTSAARGEKATPVRIASAVTNFAIRRVAGPGNELPDDITARAPG